MKFDCGEEWTEKEQRLMNWHRVFIFWPKKVASHDCRFLEFVHRRFKRSCRFSERVWDPEYRAIERPKPVDRAMSRVEKFIKGPEDGHGKH